MNYYIERDARTKSQNYSKREVEAWSSSEAIAGLESYESIKHFSDVEKIGETPDFKMSHHAFQLSNGAALFENGAIKVTAELNSEPGGTTLQESCTTDVQQQSLLLRSV
ncbi:uncharacterized protein LOC106662169 [Cimex lectularius]|uniref:Uncharacterized protein n=1 Tax=Cimex lectularius TaxID=79782 RepID=A0A8I6RCN8_CIMLE|nr:uncharacterized protein LOC106662169 [Cimex lectularius]